MLSPRIRLKSAHSGARANPGGAWRGTVGARSHVLEFAFGRGVDEEAFMRTFSLAVIAFAALSLPTAGARADGSWCANYGTGHSGINCSYKSQQECLASASGIYGFCTPNPYPGTGYGRGGSWNLPPSGRARSNRSGGRCSTRARRPDFAGKREPQRPRGGFAHPAHISDA